MAQRLAAGFPFPVHVTETAQAQRLAPGVYVNETATTAILQDHPCSLDHSLSVRLDSPAVPEWAALVRHDGVAGTQSLQALRLDLPVTLAWLTGTRSDSSAPAGALGVFRSDTLVSTEFLGAPTFLIAGEAGVLIEWIATTLAQATASAEWLQGLGEESPLNVERTSKLMFEIPGRIEATGSLFSDLRAALEWMETHPMRRLVTFVRALRR